MREVLQFSDIFFFCSNFMEIFSYSSNVIHSKVFKNFKRSRDTTQCGGFLFNFVFMYLNIIQIFYPFSFTDRALTGHILDV